MDLDELIKALQAVHTLGIAIPKLNEGRNQADDRVIDLTAGKDPLTDIDLRNNLAQPSSLNAAQDQKIIRGTWIDAPMHGSINGANIVRVSEDVVSVNTVRVDVSYEEQPSLYILVS